MKYYLLTFKDNLGDEIDVPALECFTQQEYEEWLEKPSGCLNPNYEETLRKKNEASKMWSEFWELLLEKGYTINGKANTTKIPKSDKETLEFEKKVRSLGRFNPIRVNSNIYAEVGNISEYFYENYTDLYLMKEFIENGLVKVCEVDKNFYDTFKENNLSKLSLANIFNI